jgi:protein tyrosine/serine phosphatase
MRRLESQALAALLSDRGPRRFARVRAGLYRGGQPTDEHLAHLRELGVTLVISLRREALRTRRAEAESARQLGMRFVHFPFFGLFGADSRFLGRVLDQMRPYGVYIHCKHGRDRTSLLVALSRVVHDGWSPSEAWREMLDYGYRPRYPYRRLRDTFWRMVADETLTGQRSLSSTRIWFGS